VRADREEALAAGNPGFEDIDWVAPLSADA
jgi:hypothetical protein